MPHEHVYISSAKECPTPLQNWNSFVLASWKTFAHIWQLWFVNAISSTTKMHSVMMDIMYCQTKLFMLAYKGRSSLVCTQAFHTHSTVNSGKPGNEARADPVQEGHFSAMLFWLVGRAFSLPMAAHALLLIMSVPRDVVRLQSGHQVLHVKHTRMLAQHTMEVQGELGRNHMTILRNHMNVTCLSHDHP